MTLSISNTKNTTEAFTIVPYSGVEKQFMCTQKWMQKDAIINALVVVTINDTKAKYGHVVPDDFVDTTAAQVFNEDKIWNKTGLKYALESIISEIGIGVLFVSFLNALAAELGIAIVTKIIYTDDVSEAEVRLSVAWNEVIAKSSNYKIPDNFYRSDIAKAIDPRDHFTPRGIAKELETIVGDGGRAIFIEEYIWSLIHELGFYCNVCRTEERAIKASDCI